MAREATSRPKEPVTRFIGKVIARPKVTKDLPTELEPLEPVISELPVLEPKVQGPP